MRLTLARGKARPFVLALALLLLSVGALSAMDIVADMYMYNQTGAKGSDLGSEWFYAPSGRMNLTMYSEREDSPNVRATVEMDYSSFDTISQTIDYQLSLRKFNVRVRFPGVLSFTIGKTRSTWGNGTIFNSGDILFNSTSAAISWQQDDKRQDTAWLASLNVPFSKFGFIEGVLLAPALSSTGSLTSGGSLQPGKISDMGGGGRISQDWGKFQAEGGYIYKGQHKAGTQTSGYSDFLGNTLYAAAQLDAGALWGVDMSDTLNLKGKGSSQLDSDMAKRSFSVSFNSNYTWNLYYNTQTLALDVEGVVFPYYSWTPRVATRSIGDPGYDPLTDETAMRLYASLTWSVSTWMFFVNTIYMPLNYESQIYFGAQWNVYNNLYIQSNILLNFESGETAPDTGISLGVKYTF